MEWSTVQTGLILLGGLGIYLRLVVREKQRREKHLQFRFEEQVRKLRAEKEKAEKDAQLADLVPEQTRDAGSSDGLPASAETCPPEPVASA